MYADCRPECRQPPLPRRAAEGPRALPFAHLNLRRNPFGELDLSLWADLAVVDVDRFLPRLSQPRYAVQFLGDPGRGKTTHLLAIMQHCPQAAYVHVGENERPRIPHGRPLFVDELQRVPRRLRRRLYRRPVSLVAATHEDLRSELTAAGYEVDSVEVGGALDARRLGKILDRRIEAARRGPGRLPRVTLPTARSLIDRFGDNLREIQWHVYDLFQNLPGIQDV